VHLGVAARAPGQGTDAEREDQRQAGAENDASAQAILTRTGMFLVSCQSPSAMSASGQTVPEASDSFVDDIRGSNDYDFVPSRRSVGEIRIFRVITIRNSLISF
jgi:hypothetical protein